jgi:hypothetical protein
MLKQYFPFHTLTPFFSSCRFKLHSHIRLRLQIRLLRQFFALRVYTCFWFLPTSFMFFTMDCDYYKVRLTFHSPVVLQKQIVCQSARKVLAFYRNRIFMRSRLSSLSWTTYSYVYCTPSNETTFNSIFTLSSRIRVGLPSGFYLSYLPTKNLNIFFSPPYISVIWPTLQTFGDLRNWTTQYLSCSPWLLNFLYHTDT